jgi:RimJ/RimL family protein N-acetyltransferase
MTSSDTNASIRLRDALPTDAEELVPFRRELFGQTEFMLYGPGEYTQTPAEAAAQIERMAQIPTCRSLIAEVDQQFVGMLGVVGSPVPRVRHAGTLVLGVLRNSWGQGVATAMMTEAIRWAPTVGLSRLELFVMTTNTRAMALYERLGFNVEGRRRRAYVINGVAVDDYLMSYIFDP